MVNFGTSAASSIPRGTLRMTLIFEAAARGVERHLRPQRIDKASRGDYAERVVNIASHALTLLTRSCAGASGCPSTFSVS